VREKLDLNTVPFRFEVHAVVLPKMWRKKDK
jgi:hypothetical protein